MSDTLLEMNQKVAQESQTVALLLAEVHKCVVGQHHVLERLIIALLAEGHVLLEGVPGLAKTHMVQGVAAACQATFKRIQFTPDVLPSDVIGTLIYNQKTQEFTPRLGPIFANIVLADEINRAPAKVQSALLEAMQERQVTLGGVTHPLEAPFMVLATQNPIDQEGTYVLPEAQVDRFMMKVLVQYPTKEEEKQIIETMTGATEPHIEPIITIATIERARECVRQLYVDDKVKTYVLDMVRATRSPGEYNCASIEGYVRVGASPRASLALIKASKAHAFIKGRGFVTPEDVKAVAHDVLRHRLILSFEAEAEQLTSDSLIDRVLAAIPVP